MVIFWSPWFSHWLTAFIPDWQDTTGFALWSPFWHSASLVRHFSGLCFRPDTVHLICGQGVWCCYQLWMWRSSYAAFQRLADSETLRLAACIAHLDCWMMTNRLKLNDNKTQLIWLGTLQQLTKLTVSQLRLTTYVSRRLPCRQWRIWAWCWETCCLWGHKSQQFAGRAASHDRRSIVRRLGLHPLFGLLQLFTRWDSQGPDETTTGC